MVFLEPGSLVHLETKISLLSHFLKLEHPKKTSGAPVLTKRGNKQKKQTSKKKI